ncbi:unnamed protein product, partial [Ranitomeya imitator]
TFYDVADAVVIHPVDIIYDNNILTQEQRTHCQHWVLFNLEPPLIITNLHLLDIIFNRTMMFHQDPDIFRPYDLIMSTKKSHEIYVTNQFKTGCFSEFSLQGFYNQEAMELTAVLPTSRKIYERFVHGDAFVHVDDFSGPGELAAYLLEFDKDDEKVRKYFNIKGPSYTYDSSKRTGPYLLESDKDDDNILYNLIFSMILKSKSEVVGNTTK